MLEYFDCIKIRIISISGQLLILHGAVEMLNLKRFKIIQNDFKTPKRGSVLT